MVLGIAAAAAACRWLPRATCRHYLWSRSPLRPLRCKRAPCIQALIQPRIVTTEGRSFSKAMQQQRASSRLHLSSID